MQSDRLNSALSPVVYGDIALSIKIHKIFLCLLVTVHDKSKNNKQICVKIFIWLGPD